MLDPEYNRMAGRPRVIERDRLVRSGGVYRWKKTRAVAVDIGRAPSVGRAAPDLPQSDILIARQVRAAGIEILTGSDLPQTGRISINRFVRAVGVGAPIVNRCISRDPVFIAPIPQYKGDRRLVHLAPDWEEHAARDVPDPALIRWMIDGAIRWFRDKGPAPATAREVAGYSGLNEKSMAAFMWSYDGLFSDVDVVDNQKRRKLTRAARRWLLPVLLVAALLLPALLAAPASAQQTAPGYSAPRPTPTAQTSRYRRYDTGGRSSSTPRCRWIPSLGRYQCDTDGSRYGSRRSDSEAVPGTDRRAPGVPTPRPTPTD